MAFGATTVYDADESMVMNVNQIEERWGTGIKLTKLRNVLIFKIDLLLPP